MKLMTLCSSPNAFASPILVGRGPEKLFSSRPRTRNLDSLEMVSGIVPLKLLLPAYRVSNSWEAINQINEKQSIYVEYTVFSPNDVAPLILPGSVPEKLFSIIHISRRLDIVHISSGIVPYKWLS